MGGIILNQRAHQLEKLVWSQPGIGLEQADILHREDSAYGSICLGYAIRRLIDRMDPRQVSDLLGSQPAFEPGSERAIRGQFAQRRLAA